MGLWNGRFSKDLNTLASKFTESISYDQRLYKHDIKGSIAHVQMLAKQDIIPKKDANEIEKTLLSVLESIENGKFQFKESLEDIHMNIESAIIQELGDTGARVHTARSRNDQVATDIRMYLKDEINEIVQMISKLQNAYLIKAHEYSKVIMPGFTHMQHAQPILFAHHLLAYIEMIERDRTRFIDCKKRMDVLPLGSGALAGTTLNIDREFVASQLGFKEVSRNSMDAVSDRDFALELLSAIAIMYTHLSRFAEDIILWMSSEFSFIELDDAFCTGSSLMPQKKNPDIAELIRGKTGRIFGDLFGLFTIMKGIPMTYNRDLQEDKEKIFDAIDTLKLTLPLLSQMIVTLKVNEENMLKAASDPALMATDLAEYLVRQGLPFRNAHHRVGNLVKYCKDKKIPLDKLTLKQMQETIPEAQNDCLDLFSPKKSVASREISGATGFNEVEKQITFWKKSLA